MHFLFSFSNFNYCFYLDEENGIQKAGSPSKADVELLIVCDKAFSERFDHDRQKMIDYWAVYMWDVNMRFETLRTVHITFHVTSLNIINVMQVTRQFFKIMFVTFINNQFLI